MNFVTPPKVAVISLQSIQARYISRADDRTETGVTEGCPLGTPLGVREPPTLGTALWSRSVPKLVTLPLSSQSDL